MNEWLFYLVVVLLPIAAYSGYRLGKSSRRKQANPTANLSRDYFVGLNYLLNEQPDKAIDTFVQMLEVDSETVETHLALGNLFRKRGEVDKAIRLHQNLIARPSLLPQLRKLALFELGMDYMGAGLFDRAESIFKELKPEPQHKAASLRQLMIIYQQTRDWENAVSTAEQLQAVDHQDHAKEIAHFYCELAEQHMDRQEFKLASTALKRALQIDSGCVRASMLKADMAVQQDSPKQAIKSYREVVKQNPAYVSEILPPVERAFSRLKDDKGFKLFLERSLEQSHSASLILAYADLIEKQTGERAAADFIAKQLQKYPSLKGLLKLISMHIEHAQESAKPSLQMLYDIVNKSYQSKPSFSCQTCGFSGKSLYWQCPSCKSWDTVQPLTGLGGE